MKRIVKTILRSLVVLLSLCACTSKEEEAVVEEVEEVTLISENGSTYVYFGEYPQSEVVAKAGDSGVYGKAWAKESDYIIDVDLYNALSSLADDQWDSNGDTLIDNEKYRRLKKKDATNSASDDANYYDWSNDAYHYFKYEPIKWLVLEQNDNDVFLLSEVALDDQMYNTEIKNITWETSTIRSWLNGYGASENSYGTDYSNNNFIGTAFNESALAKIVTTNVVNNDNSKNGTEGGNDTNDKLYLLSEDELYGEQGSGYGFKSNYKEDDPVRQSLSSTYSKAMGAYVETESDTLGNCFYWSRSPGSYTGLFILIRCDGSVFRGGQHANSKSRGVRVAMHITI